ncbi:MAG: signal transduction histidine kinase LytS [Bacteroidetes bacterium]|nr:MAG: signal transduction histidine kinase LytS [Bacteroidota bacterium]
MSKVTHVPYFFALRQFLFFLSCLYAFPGISQSYHFRNFSADAGLPFVQVLTIYQDSSGYLWTGGYGGLSRYDGRKFVNYSPRNGLANHLVNAVTEDAKGRLWVGTIKGINVIDGKNILLYNHTNGLPDDNVNRMITDRFKTIWIATNKGLVRWDGREFRTYGKTQGLVHEQILCLYEDKRSQLIWIGTSSGVYSFDGQRFEYFPVSTILNNSVTAIAQDKEGNILLGTGDGVYLKNERGFSLLITPPSLNMPAVNAMLTDSRGITWIGAEDGLYSYDGKHFSFYKPSRDENGRNVQSLYEDFSGNLWLGTFSGLFRFRGTGFSSFGVHDGLNNTFIYQITRDSKNNLWVGTTTGGVYVYDGKIFKSYNRSNGLPNNQANCVTEDADGMIWVGTNNGLCRFNGTSFTVFGKKEGFSSDSAIIAFIDSKKRLWIGGNNMLALYKGNDRFTSYPIPQQGQNLGIYTITEDAEGNIWAGTYLGGVYKLEQEKLERMESRLGLKNDTYLALESNHAGLLFFGSLDGVYIYSKGKIIDQLSENDGLSSNLVYSMVLDRNNRDLWIGTNQGISKFDLEGYLENGKKHFSQYGKEEGFTGVECNSSGVFRERDGILWFGTVNGLIRFDAAAWQPDTVKPKTNITGMRLFYNDTILPDNVKLAWDENNISFDYIGISLSNPHKVRYKHILEGFEKDWSPETPDIVRTYSNLPPGTFTFKVKSCNSEGIWNEEPASFTFTIATPFWKRISFWLILLSIATIALFTTIRIRIRNIRIRERREAQTKVEIAINQLKALRAQMNPHFVFNSLNSIQHFILNNNSPEAGKYLNKFARLIRMILYNSEKPSVTISEELDALRLYLDLESLRFEGKFDYEIEIGKDVDIDYFEIPTMLLQPYCENAILHGLMPKGSGGRLKIAIHLKGDILVCQVIDNGIGRAKAREIRQLSRKKDHKSMGMRITQDRLEIINRLQGSNLSLSITDLVDENGIAAGTKVEIFVPAS